MKIKPFLRWAGGKQNLVNELLKNSPKDANINTYFEPFVGAGTLFFANGFSKALISDINPQLINAYSHIKTDYNKVYELILEYNKNFNNNSEFYYKLRDKYNKERNNFDHIQAARFIFLIHTNYNGMYRVNKAGEYNVPIGKLKPCIPSFSDFNRISEKMKNTKIECFDYKEVIKFVGKNDFVYFDPPYPPLDWSNPQNQFTIQNFRKEDHEETALFADELDRMGCYVMISYPDIQFIKVLYSKWNIVTLDNFRSISCKKQRGKISELLIKNY
ncbi:MAG: Dam family site-specific DNA-(adenine-N6)-methyltransferase [Calditrichaceae bacterium]|nr:Dam family site-specific DNA-(adenine-N6)-methyltransferase [Calditrichaceae bacterium]